MFTRDYIQQIAPMNRAHSSFIEKTGQKLASWNYFTAHNKIYDHIQYHRKTGKSFQRMASLGQLAHFTHFFLSHSYRGMKFNPVSKAKSFWYYNSTSQTSVPSSLGLDSKPFEVNRKTSPDCSNFGSDPKPCSYTFHSPLCLPSFPNLGTSVHVMA